jgi:hypothetical protein
MIPGDITTKVAFAGAARGAAASLVQAIERLQDLQEAYVARDYGPAGTDEITDAEIVDASITAAQLSQLLAPNWAVSKILGLMGQEAVAGTIDGWGILDRLRSDM